MERLPELESCRASGSATTTSMPNGPDTRHHRDQHARRAHRGSGRHRDRAPASTVREFPQAERYLRAGHWPQGDYPLSQSLHDRTVGIVGLGRIGKAIARRLDAMTVPVVYHSRRPQADVPYRHYPELIAMARDADVLLVITPGGPETHNLINAEVLKALGPNGILINMSRGSVVDEAALITALKDKTILTAGLDVFAKEPEVPQELIDMDHVVLFPHLGSASVHTRSAWSSSWSTTCWPGTTASRRSRRCRRRPGRRKAKLTMAPGCHDAPHCVVASQHDAPSSDPRRLLVASAHPALAQAPPPSEPPWRWPAHGKCPTPTATRCNMTFKLSPAGDSDRAGKGMRRGIPGARAIVGWTFGRNDMLLLGRHRQSGPGDARSGGRHLRGPAAERGPLRAAEPGRGRGQQGAPADDLFGDWTILRAGTRGRSAP